MTAVSEQTPITEQDTEEHDTLADDNQQDPDVDRITPDVDPEYRPGDENITDDGG